MTRVEKPCSFAIARARPRPGRRAGLSEERGAATTLAIAIAGLLLTVGLALAWVTATVVDHRRAQSAADLAALAGAAAVVTGSPCVAADAVASANGASLQTCQVDDREVVVEVSLQGPTWWGRSVELRARARAGPAR